MISSSDRGRFLAQRFNVLRHGLRSAQTVLPWEAPAEYEGVRKAFLAQYAPVNPTEAHLVDEIAGIVWRKRRLHLAETGAVRDRLALDCTTGSHDDESRLAFPEPSFVAGRTLPRAEVRTLHQLAEAAPEAASRALAETRAALAAEAAAPAGSSDPNAARGCKALRVREGFLAQLDGLRARALDETMSAPGFERLARYETRLDRKLERCLSMLLKLQDLRRGRDDRPAAGPGQAAE